MAIIIAELGHNWNGNLGLAFEMIREAKECGADVAKFQLYDIDKIMTSDNPVYDDLKRGQVTREQWEKLVKECQNVGIEFLASVFDAERVKWCEDVGMKRYKIASRSIYDMDLLEAVGATRKPVIVSLGMMDRRGIPKFNHGTTTAYLYCVAKYPTELNELDLRHVDFCKYQGFSDHTMGTAAAVFAIARGAQIIEKHFTLDKSMDGCDQACSMEPEELRELVTLNNRFKEIR